MRNLKRTVFRLQATVKRIERKQDRILAELLLIKCKNARREETERLFTRLREAALRMERDSRKGKEWLLKSQLKPYGNER